MLESAHIPTPGTGYAMKALAAPATALPCHEACAAEAQRRRWAFRKAGRPVVYVAHVLRPDYSDAQFPYWRVTRGSLSHNRTFIAEGTWGAQIIDELKP